MMKIMEKKRIRTQKNILKSARLLFSQHGFEQTSMESIATRAEVAAGTLYNYYPSKPVLLIAIFADLTEKMQLETPKRSSKIMTQETALQDLTAILQYLSQATILFPKAIMRQIFAYLFVLPTDEIAQLFSLDMKIIELLMPVLADMQTAGFLVKDQDLQEVAVLLYGSAMLQHQIFISMPEMTEAQLNHAISSQVKLMFFGLLPR